MIRFAYLAALLGPLAGMAVIDWRWRLFAWRRPRRALAVVAVGTVFFLAWDLVAIALGFYERGESPGMTGVEVLPELPVEEPVFVVFLCYVTMVLRQLVALVLLPRVRPGGGSAARSARPARSARSARPGRPLGTQGRRERTP